MSLPNVVIAGVNKGGTTSLFSYLAAHPEICASSVKETCYFLPLRYGGEVGPLSEYEAFFSDCAGRPCRLESTPGYFYGGRRVASAIDETLAEARVIVILRDPVERAFSFFKFMQSMLELERGLGFDAYVERCLGMPPAEKRLQENNVWWGIDGGFYAEPLTAWHDVFGRRLRVLFFDDLRDRPLELLRDVAGWLGIDPAHFDEGFQPTVENRTVPYQSALLHGAALRLNRMGERFFRARPRLKQRLRRAYQRLNRGKPTEGISDATRARLREVYRADGEALRHLLSRAGVPTPPWLARERLRHP